ncbi:MAG: hypothetical protein AB7G23_00660 [Vicinamibacterales bacterium]
MKTMTFTLLGLVMLAGSAAAQVPGGPTPNCNVTPAQIQENKRVALQFFAPGVDRLALADPSYIQHNPAFVKGAREAGLNDYDYFKSRFGGPPAARGGGGGRGRQGGTPPPAGNPTDIVLAECDLVTVVHLNYVQDPTAPPGTFYARSSFDTFRVRNGKLVEHWDGAVINPPAAGRGGQ